MNQGRREGTFRYSIWLLLWINKRLSLLCFPILTGCQDRKGEGAVFWIRREESRRIFVSICWNCFIILVLHFEAAEQKAAGEVKDDEAEVLELKAAEANAEKEAANAKT